MIIVYLSIFFYWTWLFSIVILVYRRVQTRWNPIKPSLSSLSYGFPSVSLHPLVPPSVEQSAARKNYCSAAKPGQTPTERQGLDVLECSWIRIWVNDIESMILIRYWLDIENILIEYWLDIDWILIHIYVYIHIMIYNMMYLYIYYIICIYIYIHYDIYIYYNICIYYVIPG